MNMTQVPQGKPLPEITDLTRPFWTATKNRKLVMQKCTKCMTFNFYPKPWCVECGCRAMEWTEVSTEGVVYSFTVAHTVMMNYPAWKEDLPITIAIVDVDGAGRMYAQITDCPPEKLRVGMRVKLHFSDMSAEITIPKFRPV